MRRLSVLARAHVDDAPSTADLYICGKQARVVTSPAAAGRAPVTTRSHSISSGYARRAGTTRPRKLFSFASFAIRAGTAYTSKPSRQAILACGVERAVSLQILVTHAQVAPRLGDDSAAIPRRHTSVCRNKTTRTRVTGARRIA